MAKGIFVRQSASAHGGPSDYEILPQLMPATNTSICTDDIHITEIVLTASADCTVRIRDNQGTAAPLIADDTPLTAKTVTVVEFPRGALMVGGLSWSCSSGTAVYARMRGF